MFRNKIPLIMPNMDKEKLEAREQQRIVRYLKGLGYLVQKIESSSSGGWPDLFAAKTKEKTFWVECKRVGESARKLQEYQHELLRKHGQKVYVFDSLGACQSEIKD